MSVDELVEGFENGTLPGAQFNHAAHVTVAAWYITRGDDALNQLRTRIPAYNVSQGGANTDTSGYHESLTCFWFHCISDYLDSLPSATSRTEKIQAAVAEFGSKAGLFKDYYDYDVVKSRDARRAWMAPTLPPETLRRWRERELSTARA